MMSRNFFERAVRVFGENSDLILIAYSFYKQYRGRKHTDDDEWGMDANIDIENCLKEVHRNMDSQMFCNHFHSLPIYAEGFDYQRVKDGAYWKLVEHENQFYEERNPAFKPLYGRKTELRRLDGEEFEYAMNSWRMESFSLKNQFLFLRALVYNENIYHILSEDEVYEYLCEMRGDQRIEAGDCATATKKAYLIMKGDRIVKDFGVSFDKEKAEEWAKKFGGKAYECVVSYHIWLGVGKHFI